MKKILIANRGEIARRIVHTAHAMGIATVAVYSDPDAQALHVREATQAVALGGSASADSYLRIDKLLAAAHATGADAVHPGYGFLSESAECAQAVADAGLVWIGPSAGAIRALGSKAGAKALAQAQGVPCLPGYAGDDQSDERFAAEAERTGFPLMVKAVAGGGGRGMRLVADAAQLPTALASARSEALAGFGCGDLLIERALLNPRHVEVQVFADAHGHCIHLGERDCSVQRRHQKLIEESPSPAVDTALRERMGACAVALAQSAGYVGAGTVEFLLDDSDPQGRFYLMEMNTRLQVEHPVTEALTGLDLVEWQIRVARGEPLPLAQHQVALQGHAIEVRLCAEDARFTPHTGRVHHLAAPHATAFERAPLGRLRFDHALEQGTEVTPHYDAMLGKLIVHAATRDEAIDALVRALEGTTLLGLPCNRAFLAACLNHPQFRAGQARVPFLTQEGDALRDVLHLQEQAALLPGAMAALFPPRATTLPCSFARPMRLRHQGDVQALAVRELGPGQLRVEQQGAELESFGMHLTPLPDGRMQCAVEGVTHAVRTAAVGPHRWHWQAGGVDGWVEDASWEPATRAGTAGGANELRAPFNGRVVAVPVSAGEALQAGATVVVLESMKLEHSLVSLAATTVAELLVAPSQQVAPGQVLARFAVQEA